MSGEPSTYTDANIDEILSDKDKRIAELESHVREAAREKALLEYERWSALQHIAQLLMGREPAEVAWWLQKNHAAFVRECAPHVRAKIDEMAAAAD